MNMTDTPLTLARLLAGYTRGEFQVRDIVAKGGPSGKRLDFLAQELGREANTIGSKSDSAALAQEVVVLKGEIERFREQVQNVE